MLSDTADNCIDDDDMSFLIANYGRDDSNGSDINNDGVTDLSDLAILSGNYEEICTTSIFANQIVNPENVSEGFTTVGRIPGGALIENSVPVTMVQNEKYLELLLDKTDFTTCSRIAEAININFQSPIAEAIDGGTIQIEIPSLFKNNLVKFVANIERLEVVPDYRSKIIVNERTGTIVGGSDVSVSPVSLNYKNISIEVEPTDNVQAMIQSGGTAAVQDLPIYSSAFFEEGEATVENTIAEGVSVGDLTKYLNSLGITPKDLISILSAIKATGAIQADVVVV